MTLKCDAVFEGGGVKGIGLAGAITAIENAGYEFVNLAGTSAGSIAASLLAVGYTGKEIGDILLNLDYLKFKDTSIFEKISFPGKLLNTILEFGIYEGDYFEKWIENLFKAKGKVNFGDIKNINPANGKYEYKFQAIASDLTDRKMLVLPGDLKNFGYDPDKFSISKAIRMSISIPLFFEPFRLTDITGKVHHIVDGGVLSNYPIWLLDDGTSDPKWPTFGFKLIDTDKDNHEGKTGNSINNIVDFFESLVGTMLDAHDNYHISESKGDFERTIPIPTTIKIDNITKKISTTDFRIKPRESKALFDNGFRSAENFLKTWNFDSWKKKFRENN